LEWLEQLGLEWPLLFFFSVWRRAKHCGEYGRRYKQYLGSGTWTQKHLHLLKAGGSKRVGRYHVDSWSNASQIDLGLIESKGGRKNKDPPADICVRSRRRRHRYREHSRVTRTLR
jgi:hypothetical protein